MRRSKRAIKAFLLFTTFLEFAGIGIVLPTSPFIVTRYADRDSAALVIALLSSCYSLAQLAAIPYLGALSDRYGRRPILLVSLFGSAIGYLLLGIGGSLWVLFLGRVVDGITGGNISTIYAAGADLNDGDDRTQFFGLLGAIHGLGIVLGPMLGGAIYAVTGDVTSPAFLAAGVTLLNLALGAFVLPETLAVEHRSVHSHAGPLEQFADLFRVRSVRPLLLSIFFWQFAFAIFISNVAYLTEDRLGWQPDGAGVLFSICGLIVIVVQVGLVKRLLAWLGEVNLTTLGFGLMALGFVLLAAVTSGQWAGLIYAGAILATSGNGLLNAALNGLLSKRVSASEQGRAQAANQSVEALARVVGPVSGGWVYDRVGQSATYLGGAAILLLGAVISGAARAARSAQKLSV